MTNTRQKGMALSKYIAQQIKEKGLDDRAYARGDSGAGNKEKTDITTNVTVLGRPIGVEAKNSKNASVTPWWEQTQKLEKLGYEPVLVYSLHYESFDEAKAVIYLDTLLELLKSKDIKQEQKPPETRTLQYKKDKLVHALKDFLKTLE